LPQASQPAGHPPPPVPSALGQAPPAPHVLDLAPLPPPPPQWQGAEDAMRSWLATKSEEERRRQEEEKTRQESLRLDQRRVEFEQSKIELEQKKVAMDILQRSLSSGIPAPLVPVVFAGMGAVAGGTLPQAALEWAQQFMPQGLAHPPQLMGPGQVSPHRRDSQPQAYGQYSAVPSTPGSAPGPGAGYSYPGSPTRSRGHSLSAVGSLARPVGQGSNLPNINTTVPQPGGPSSLQPHSGHPLTQASSAAPQQEAQSSPSIYFHYWHPPTSHAAGSSSAQPAPPSGSSKTKRKRESP
jgi:hypothetical protein